MKTLKVILSFSVTKWVGVFLSLSEAEEVKVRIETDRNVSLCCEVSVEIIGFNIMKPSDPF